MFLNMLETSFHSDPIPLCRQIIARYFLDDSAATIVPFIGNEGFSGARIYRVEMAGQCYSLRRWPLNAPEPQRLAGLHRLLELTWKQGVTQIAVPLKLKNGSTLLKVGGHYWHLEPWLPGVADFHLKPTRTRLQESMRVLSQWHHAAQTFNPGSDEHVWFASVSSSTSPGLQERYQAIQRYQQMSGEIIRSKLDNYPDLEVKTQLAGIWRQFQTVSSEVAQSVLQISSSTVALQPCWRDVWHDHLLFTGDKLTGLIDPGACRTENVTTDLARLLGSLLEDDRAEWDFALNCYQQIRPLSLVEFRMLHAFDDSGVLLSGMTWIDWLLIQQLAFTNRKRVLDRLQVILRRLEKLVDRINRY